MQNDPTSIPATSTDAWNNPASLGFSTWQRHTAVSLGNGSSMWGATYGQGDNQGGLRANYHRHASFAADLIARRHQGSEAGADAGRFIYASPMTKQRYSYRTLQFEPPLLQRKAYHKPYQGLAASTADSGMISRTLASGSFQTTVPPRDGAWPYFSSFASHTEGRAALPIGPLGGPLTRIFRSTNPSLIDPPLTGSVGILARKLNPGGSPGSPSSSFPSYGQPPGIYSQMRSEESLHRTYKRAGAVPMWTAEPGSTINFGPSPPAHNPSLELVQRHAGNPHVQLSGRQTLPVIPLASQATTTARTTAVPALMRNGGAGNLSSSFSGLSRRVSTIFSPRKTVYRKPGVGNAPKIEPAPQLSIDRQLAVVAAEPSGARGSVFSSGLSESLNKSPSEITNVGFHDARIPDDHASAPNSIPYVLRRALATSSPATPLIGAPGPLIGGSGLAVNHESSIALTHSARLTTPPHSSSEDTQAHLILRRSVATSRLGMSAEDRSGIASDSTQDRTTHALLGHIESAQSMQSHLMPKHSEHAQGYKRYEVSGAGILSAIQRLQSKTSPFAAHRKVMMPRLAEPSVYSPRAQYAGTFSNLSERILLKKPISLLAKVPAPHDGPAPHLQLSRVSRDVTSNQDDPLPPYISPQSMTRSGAITGEITASPHAGIRDATRVLRRMEPSTGRSIMTSRTNDRSSFPGSAIADHSVSAIAARTRPSRSSPALTVSRKTAAKDSIGLRSFAASSTSAGLSMDSMVINSTVIDSMGTAPVGSSGSTDPRSSAISPVRYAPRPLSSPPSISLRRSSTLATRSTAPDSADYVNGSLHLTSLALPYSAYPPTRYTIVRSAEQPRMSISKDGPGISASAKSGPENRSFSLDQATIPAQSGGTARFNGRPLAILQRSQNRLMRTPSEGDGTLAISDHPEDRYGLVSPSSGPVAAQSTQPSDAKKMPESKLAQPDLDETVEQAWRIMTERLVIEQERRGLAKWP